jgi:hypothetical protein
VRALVAMVAFALFLAGGVYAVATATGMWDVPESERPDDGPDIPEGWRIHRAAGIAVALPSSWTVLGRSEGWDTSAFRRANPELARYLGEAARGRSPNNKLMAFDTSPLARVIFRRSGFATNFGIIKAPSSDSRSRVWKQNLAGLRGIPGRIGPVRSRRVTLAGRPALWTRFRTEAASARGRALLSTTQWSVVSSGYEYVLTFGTMRSAEQQYARFVEQMLKTLVLPEPRERPPGTSFAARANRICDSHLAPASASKLGEAERIRVIAPVYVAQIRDLRALEPPPALAGKYDAMLHHAAKIPGGMRRYADALDAGHERAAAAARARTDRAAKAASKLSRELGLTSCAG